MADHLEDILARVSHVGLELPSLLRTLLTDAEAPDVKDALDIVGVLLEFNATDAVGDPREAEEDNSEDVDLEIASRFVGFAGSGGGDVYGLFAPVGAGSTPPAV